MTARWRGLAELVQDAVHHGTIAVERVHQRVARTPLELVARVRPLAGAARAIAELQSGMIGATYETIRGVNGLVGAVVAAALAAAARDAPPDAVAPPTGAR